MTNPVPISPERSRLMSRVRRRDTAAEVAVGRQLRQLGASYRKDVKALAGAPDFANRSKGWAVFVNGCFWHLHTGCSRSGLPKNNAEFWGRKLTRNRLRDAAAIRALRAQGFVVVVVWECSIAQSEQKLAGMLRRAEGRRGPKGISKTSFGEPNR